jgi:sulfide:quinone oxidoreductase
MATTLILGGGFGGIAAANELRGLLPARHEVVLVDRSPSFHVGAGKTWVMLGERTVEQISSPRRGLLAEGVELLQAEVESIDLSRRSVSAGGRTRSWDHLVIALGADVTLEGVPGLAEAAETFYTLPGAQRLRQKLQEFQNGDLVILIPRAPFKCPPAPYEAAMLLHSALDASGKRVRMAIHTVEPAPMPTAGPDMGAFIREQLAERGIAYHPGKTTASVDPAARRVRFQDGSEAAYDLLIAVPLHVAPKVVRDAQLTNQAGWVPVDPATLRVAQPNIPEGVYAIGDVTALPLPGRFNPQVPLSLPKAGVFAEAQGKNVAETIAAAILGRQPAGRFDGRGYCFLEVGGGRAVRAEGSFFALPNPVMERKQPDSRQLEDKRSWVAQHLSGPHRE